MRTERRVRTARRPSSTRGSSRARDSETEMCGNTEGRAELDRSSRHPGSERGEKSWTRTKTAKPIQASRPA